MSGRRSRNKGAGYEREIVAAHIERGIDAKKTPLSGALRDYPGDVQIAGIIGECKRTKRKRTSLYEALAQGNDAADVLFVRDDMKSTLVVMHLEFWFQLLNWAGIPQKFPARPGGEIGASDQSEGEA